MNTKGTFIRWVTWVIIGVLAVSFMPERLRVPFLFLAIIGGVILADENLRKQDPTGKAGIQDLFKQQIPGAHMPWYLRKRGDA